MKVYQHCPYFSINRYAKMAVIGLFCLVSEHVKAKGLEIGLRYMVQKSWLTNSSDKAAGAQLEPASTWSYLNGGLAVDYSVNKMIGVEVDILHSRQGQSYTGTTPVYNSPSYSREVVLQALVNGTIIAGPYQAKAELNCWKIPIMLKLSTDNSKALSFHLLAGPQINIISSAVYELNHEDVDLPGMNITPDDTYKTTTIDGVLSLGAGYRFGSHFGVSADLRFDYGFGDVEKKDITYSYLGSPALNYYATDRAATHNASMGLMAGINYKL